MRPQMCTLHPRKQRNDTWQIELHSTTLASSVTSSHHHLLQKVYENGSSEALKDYFPPIMDHIDSFTSPLFPGFLSFLFVAKQSAHFRVPGRDNGTGRVCSCGRYPNESCRFLCLVGLTINCIIFLVQGTEIAFFRCTTATIAHSCCGCCLWLFDQTRFRPLGRISSPCKRSHFFNVVVYSVCVNGRFLVRIWLCEVVHVLLAR
jgi:hypothetical protein